MKQPTRRPDSNTGTVDPQPNVPVQPEPAHKPADPPAVRPIRRSEPDEHRGNYEELERK